jgi:pimeloyl-ACP methyl ester carboxylesterase
MREPAESFAAPAYKPANPVEVAYRDQEWLVDNLPCAQSHVIDGAAHNVQSTHPREFSELLTSLVEGVNRRHSS